MNRRLKQPGQAGELAAQQWFLNNGWTMFRTQPAVEILGVAKGRRFGNIFTVRMVGRGGIPDFIGYSDALLVTISGNSAPECMMRFRACEVKEASGSSMPCSRLDKEQRAFMDKLPEGCAWVGVLWVDHGKFTMHPYKKSGKYEMEDFCELRKERYA